VYDARVGPAVRGVVAETFRWRPAAASLGVISGGFGGALRTEGECSAGTLTACACCGRLVLVFYGCSGCVSLP